MNWWEQAGILVGISAVCFSLGFLIATWLGW